MIEIKAPGGESILLYKSAEELPIKRYSKFQKYNLVESGVGSDMDAIAKHFSKLFEYHAHSMLPEAVQESRNLYYSFYMMLEELNIPGLAFACLIHSIEGEVLTDTTEENLLKIVERLDLLGVSQKTVEGYIQDVKKKSLTN